MTTQKLTLSAEKRLIEQAKRVARKRKTSVSAMVSRFLRSMTEESAPTLGPITQKASGMIRLPKGRADRDLLQDALQERYGPRP